MAGAAERAYARPEASGGRARPVLRCGHWAVRRDSVLGFVDLGNGANSPRSARSRDRKGFDRVCRRARRWDDHNGKLVGKHTPPAIAFVGTSLSSADSLSVAILPRRWRSCRLWAGYSRYLLARSRLR